MPVETWVSEQQFQADATQSHSEGVIVGARGEKGAPRSPNTTTEAVVSQVTTIGMPS